MIFLEEKELDKDYYLKRTYENNKLDEYLNSIEYDNETEENKIKEVLECDFFNIKNEDYESDAEEFDEKWSQFRSTSVKDKGKNYAKSKGLLLMKYIDKTINFKKDVLAKETFPRKLLRLSISAILIFGPLFIPGGKIIKLIGCLTGAVIADKVSKKQKQDLIDLYETKIKQINEKIEETDDEKDRFELEKIKKSMAKDAAKIKYSISQGNYIYDMEKNS